MPASAPKPPCAGGPPPPPMAFVPPPIDHQPVKTNVEADKGALFAELNVGEDITKRLKKVDKAKLEQEK